MVRPLHRRRATRAHQPPGDGWFWLGIALVLAFFAAARLIEASAHGSAVLDGLDRLTRPMWGRLDDYMRAITPDLRTPAEWVSWMQLVIAAHVGPAVAGRFTHSHNPEHPDGLETDGGIGAPPTR